MKKKLIIFFGLFLMFMLTFSSKTFAYQTSEVKMSYYGEEIFNVITTGGDSHLGGDDFNQRIIDYCLNEFCKNFNFNIKDVRKDSEAMNRLKIAAEKAKIKLSDELETTIDIDEFFIEFFFVMVQSVEMVFPL